MTQDRRFGWIVCCLFVVVNACDETGRSAATQSGTGKVDGGGGNDVSGTAGVSARGGDAGEIQGFGGASGGGDGRVGSAGANSGGSKGGSGGFVIGSDSGLTGGTGSSGGCEGQAVSAEKAADDECAWVIPAVPLGRQLDPERVNVRYTLSSGRTVELRRLLPGSGCTAEPDGWYYDDPRAPTKVVLCRTSCTAVVEDEGANVDVVFGCVTDVGL